MDIIQASQTEFSIGLFLLFLSGFIFGWTVCRLSFEIKKSKTNPFINNSKGNIFTALFAAVGLLAVLGSGLASYISGPLTTAHNVTMINNVSADLLTNANMIGQALSQQGVGADIDNDSYVEPPQYDDTCDNKPIGGGCLPMDIGAQQTDPWGTRYGYCVWDHGNTTGSERRLEGTTTTAGPLIAIISAGKDKTFNTSCHGYLEASVDAANINTIIAPSSNGGGDDRVRMYTYEKAAASSYITELPDEACTAATAGLMRYDMETLQICNGTDWTEVSAGALAATGTFDPVVDAPLSTEYTSNTIVFEDFLGERQASVTGGATIIVNGVAQGSTATIRNGDSIALRANSATAPEVRAEFELSVSAIRRVWAITTRDKTPTNITITPQNASSMIINGPGFPAYGDSVVFIIENIGENTSDPISSATLSNMTNFELFDIGDGCTGRTLAQNEQCFVEVRPLASDGGTYNGNLGVIAGTAFATANMTATGVGWQCNLPWGGTIASGQSVTAFATSSVPHGNSCISQTRTCNGNILTGNYTAPSCTVLPPPYTYAWEVGPWGPCQFVSGLGWVQTRSVVCRRSDGASVSGSFCPGSDPGSLTYCSNGGGGGFCGGFGGFGCD